MHSITLVLTLLLTVLKSEKSVQSGKSVIQTEEKRERRLGLGNLTKDSCLNHGLTGLPDDTDFENKLRVVFNYYGSSPN